jgi:acyl carrier protein
MDIHADVLATLRDFVLMNFLMADESLAEDDSLTGSGIVDSTGLLELVLFMEEAFNLEIPQEDVLPEQFDTLNLLAGYVVGRLAAPATATAERRGPVAAGVGSGAATWYGDGGGQ